MPNGSTHVDCAWTIAWLKSSAVSSSQCVESFACARAGDETPAASPAQMIVAIAILRIIVTPPGTRPQLKFSEAHCSVLPPDGNANLPIKARPRLEAAYTRHARREFPMPKSRIRILVFLLTITLVFVSTAAAQVKPVAHGLWVWKGPTVVATEQGTKSLRDFCVAQSINEV